MSFKWGIEAKLLEIQIKVASAHWATIYQRNFKNFESEIVIVFFQTSIMAASA